MESGNGVQNSVRSSGNLIENLRKKYHYLYVGHCCAVKITVIFNGSGTLVI